jgi:hypothetical protein
MRFDRLLTYLSELGQGDWDELREAWRWIAGDSDDPADKAWIAAQDLSSLGHVEVAWGDEVTWCAAPPVLTMIPRSGGRALLTGGRTRALYDPLHEGGPTGRLVEAVDELNLVIDEWPAPKGPTTVMVACESALDAQNLASALGIEYTFSVADQLAGVLPRLESYERFWEVGELPRGFDAERFDPQHIRWQPTEDAQPLGLYRCRTWQRHVHALHGPVGWFRVPRELAVYEVLRWSEHTVIGYDSTSMELKVPVGARLPVLHNRTATLCSGRLARFVREDGKGLLIYDNVSRVIADLIALSLGQRLENRDS